MSDNILKSKQDANQVLRLAFDDDAQALRTIGSTADTVTVIQPDGSLLHTTVDASALPTGAATEAKQDSQIALETNIQTYTGNTSSQLADVIAGTSSFKVDGSDVTQPVSAVSLPLPTGAATEAKQDDANVYLSAITTTINEINTDVSTAAKQDIGNASLASIDTKLTSPLSISAASLPLPTGASTESTLSAFATKSASAAVTEAFDEQVIAYVGATTDIDTVTYKLAGTTVATLTMSYDGSNRLVGVVKT